MSDTSSPGSPAALDSPGALVRFALEEFEVPLTRYAVSILRDVGLAQDAVQDTLLKLYHQDPESVRTKLKSWLFTVCRNRCLDIIKKEKRMIVMEDQQMPPIVSAERDPSESVVHDENRAEVAGHMREMFRQIENLPDNQREVLRLKFQGGLSYREIGDALGLRTGNVGFLIHTGLKKLRKLMIPHMRASSIGQQTWNDSLTEASGRESIEP